VHDDVARIGTGEGLLRFAESEQDVVDGGIAIAVDGDLPGRRSDRA
jgi:hypothetical protein